MDSLKDIKSFYKGLLDRQIISQDHVDEFPVAEQKYHAMLEDVCSRLKVKLSTGFCSSILWGQIARHYCGIGERFGDKIEFYHGSTILDTIELIETGKLQGEQFAKSRLIGRVYKTHHSALSQAHSITKNIFNGLSDKVIQSAKQRAGGNLPALLNTIHSDIIGKKKRTGRLTGEWIVFARVGSVNYYLCLATHEEGHGEAVEIYNRLKPSFEEFPELSQFRK